MKNSEACFNYLIQWMNPSLNIELFEYLVSLQNTEVHRGRLFSAVRPQPHYVEAERYQVTWWPGEKAEDDINSQSTKGSLHFSFLYRMNVSNWVFMDISVTRPAHYQSSSSNFLSVVNHLKSMCKLLVFF